MIRIIKVDQNSPLLIKALIKYGPYRQKYYAEQLGISPSNLSAYLNGSKKMSKELCDGLLELLDFNPQAPFLEINNNPNYNR